MGPGTQAVSQQQAANQEQEKGSGNLPPLPEQTKLNPENLREDIPNSTETAYSKVVRFSIPAGKNYVLYDRYKAGEGGAGFTTSRNEALAADTLSTGLGSYGQFARDKENGAGSLKLSIKPNASGVVLLSLEDPKPKNQTYQMPERFYAIDLSAPASKEQRSIEIPHLKADSFAEAQAPKPGEVSVVICSATWCPPCGKQLPNTLLAVGTHSRSGPIRVGYLDMNDEALAGLVAKYDVKSLPTTIVFRAEENGKQAEPVLHVGVVSVDKLLESFKPAASPDKK